MEKEFVVLSKTDTEYGVILVENGLIKDEFRTQSVEELKNFIGDKKVVEYSMNMSSLPNDFEDILAMAKERYSLLNNSLSCICDNAGVEEKSEDAIEKCKTIYQVYMVMSEHPPNQVQQVQNGSGVQQQVVINTPTSTPQGISDKDWVVTLLLCLFLGCLGVHRFYVGKVGSGIAQILVVICTCGIGAIWPFIDLIMIICGNFTDADGRLIKQK